MLNNFGINLTRSTDDPDRATVAMVVANAAVASGKNTMVFLSSEGVRLAVKGVADNIHEEGLQPMADLPYGYAHLVLRSVATPMAISSKAPPLLAGQNW